MDKNLKELADKFASWRSCRKTKTSPVPTELRSEALSLLGRYKMAHIAKAVGISSGVMHRWQKNHPESKKSEFVSLPLTLPAPSRAEELAPRVELSSPDGYRLSFENIPGSAYVALISKFMGGGRV
ncbi:MAG: hypothetical protein Tsb0018_11150 [Opitutales bacterium]